MAIGLISAYFFIKFLIQLLYLIWQPKFLVKDTSKMLTKSTMIMGYLALIVIMAVGALRGLGIISIKLQINEGISTGYFSSTRLLIAVALGIIAATISEYILYKKNKR